MVGEEVRLAVILDEKINVSDLARGIYFMIIETNSSKRVRRFVKK